MVAGPEISPTLNHVENKGKSNCNNVSTPCGDVAGDVIWQKEASKLFHAKSIIILNLYGHSLRTCRN